MMVAPESTSAGVPPCAMLGTVLGETEHMSAPDVVPTLYEWAGGSEAFDRLTEVFYRRHVPSDEIVGPVFAKMRADHPHHVALWLGEVFGGPADYSYHHGGYSHMVAKHIGLALTEPQRARWVQLIGLAADDAGSLPILSSAQPSSPISSGAHGSRSQTLSRTPTRHPRPPCPTGDGEKHRPTDPEIDDGSCSASDAIALTRRPPRRAQTGLPFGAWLRRWECCRRLTAFSLLKQGIPAPRVEFLARKRCRFPLLHVPGEGGRHRAVFFKGGLRLSSVRRLLGAKCLS